MQVAIPAVVHHAFVVVLAGDEGVSCGELAFPVRLDVVEVHCDVLVAIVPLLLVRHA